MEQLDIKLQYGLRSEKIVCIGDLTESERGLACNCVCPNCRNPLIARLGEKRQRHFAHQSAECNVQIAKETALHRLAKEIIEEEKTIKLPAYYISCEDVGIQNEYHLSPKKYIEPKDIEFDDVRLENIAFDIVPDIIATKNGKECLIEIAVTHFVDDKKKKKVKDSNQTMIEIDLSKCDYNVDRMTLTTILKGNENSREKIDVRWINYPEAFKKFRDNAAQEFRDEFKKQEHIKRENENMERERQRRNKENEKIKSEIETNIKKAYIPENYRMIIEKSRNDKEAILHYKKTKMYSQKNKIPFYYDIPIKGEFIFKCDRRIWQMMLYEKFIYYGEKKKIRTITEYFLKSSNIINQDYNSKDGLSHIVEKYIGKLEKLGHCFYDEFHQYVKRNQESNPLRAQYAELLESAMSIVDCLSVDAEEKIDEYIRQNLNS